MLFECSGCGSWGGRSDVKLYEIKNEVLIMQKDRQSMEKKTFFLLSKMEKMGKNDPACLRWLQNKTCYYDYFPRWPLVWKTWFWLFKMATKWKQLSSDYLE